MDKIDQAVETICKALLFILFAAMVISAFIQVVMRTLFSNPLTWTEELCRYSMVWLAMIGSGLAVKYKSHIAIDILKNALPETAVRVIDRFNHIMIILFSAVLIYFGFLLCGRNMQQITPGLKLPMGAVYGAMPVGGFIMLYYAVVNIFRRSEKQ